MVSAAKILSDAVVKNDDGSWDIYCPITDGSCGPQDQPWGWSSIGWNTKAVATKRLRQHLTEHREAADAKAEGRPVDPSKIMPELSAFLEAEGLKPHADGRHVVSIDDLDGAAE